MHLEELRALFLQVLKLCQAAGLVKLGQVAFDGTKVQGNASKHKAMSYKRMLETELRLKQEIEALLKQGEATDQAEDARYGAGVRGDELPAELLRRETRLARIREAKAKLEEEAKQARAEELREQAEKARERAQTHADETERKRAATVAERKEEEAKVMGGDDEPPPSRTPEGLPMHHPKTKPDGTPDDKAQRNFTDPESRIVESGGNFLQGYNCQTAVDAAHQIIVGQAVTNQSPDNGNLVPMVNDPYVSTARGKHGTSLLNPPPTPVIDNPDERELMRRKLSTPEGKAIYARRKAIVEPVNGQIKEAQGFRRFLLRGLPKVSGEWSLVCTCHNLLKLFRASIKARVLASAPA